MTTLERLALGVQLPGLNRPVVDADLAALLAEGLGGVCLFGPAATGGVAAVRALTDRIHAAGPGAVVATDEEGGDVTRLYADVGSPVLGAAALGAADDLGLTEATGRAVGSDLAAAGIDLTLAPVADLNTDPDNPVIGVRSFGADPARAGEHVAAWVRGLQSAGVAGCAKHFPGHGDTSDDSHLTLPVVHADLATLQARELVPFASAIGHDVAAVMTSHLLLPLIDRDRPATFSPTLLGLLRDELAYDGAIITDALDMAGASGARGIPEAAVLALVAGADLLCLGSDSSAELVREVQSAIVAAVADGRLTEQRLSEAQRRASSLRRLHPAGPSVFDADAQLAGAHAAMTVEGPLPDLAGAVVTQVSTTANIAVGTVPWGLSVTGTPVPGRPVVVQVKDAHRHPGVREQLLALAQAGPVVVVEYGWPGPLGLDLPRICTRGASRPSTTAAAEVLAAAGWSA
jgi:beta-N-acetylhexosaminidase